MSDEVKIPLPRSLQDIVGALLFASESPLTAGEIRDAIRAVEPEAGADQEVMGIYQSCTGREVESALRGIEKALEVAGCGFKLVCTNGAYKLQTTSECGRYVRAMLKMDRPTKLGRASLETLAIVAYRQPLTRSEIEEIRGVDVSANLKTLMDLGLIRLVGKSELPGHPFLYGTTALFLEHFGLANLQQLNEMDPTLQRSNPRLKAAAYKKREKVGGESRSTAEGEVVVESGSGSEGEEGEKVGGESRSTAEGEVVVESGSGSEEGQGEEEIFIDDTPDEFDEEDEEDDDDDEDEGADGDGAGDDADGV